MKILIAEGDTNHLSDLAKTLQQELSAEVTCVSSQEQCLEKLQENGYHGVILDYRLPGKSVLSIMNVVKRGNENSALIVLFGQLDEKMARDCVRSGADDYIIRTSEYLTILPVVLTQALEKIELRQRDVTLRRELVKQSKYSAIGRMVSGIGHNINSPLASIMGRAQLFIQREKKEQGELLAKKDVLPPEEFERQMLRHEKNIRDMNSISESAAKISLIVKNMTHKSHHEQSETIEYLNLNDLLKEELNFLEADMFFKHDVTKHYRFADSLPYLKGIYSDFSQSLIAIVHNILNALRSSEKKEIIVTTGYNNQSVSITIHHTGCYMDEREISILHNLPSLPGINLHSAHELLQPYRAQISCAGQPGDSTVIIEIPYTREQS